MEARVEANQAGVLLRRLPIVLLDTTTLVVRELIDDPLHCFASHGIHTSLDVWGLSRPSVRLVHGCGGLLVSVHLAVLTGALHHHLPLETLHVSNPARRTSVR